MDSVYNRLAYLGHVIRGHPPALSPTLDDFEMMKYIRRTLQPAKNNFCILMSVSLFQLEEIEIKVLLKKGLIEIRAKHDRRQDLGGLWMTRDSTYTYELPKEFSKKELHAQWSEDDYLFIQTTSSNYEVDIEEITLVPDKVQRKMFPVVNMRHIKEHIDDMRDEAQYILRYIRFHTPNRPVVKEIEAIVDQPTSDESSQMDSHSIQGEPQTPDESSQMDSHSIQGEPQTPDITSKKDCSSDQQSSGIASEASSGQQTSGESSEKVSPSDQHEQPEQDSSSEQSKK